MAKRQRLSLRHINHALRALACQQNAGAIDLAAYRAQRDTLLDHLVSPDVQAALIDDAPTEPHDPPATGEAPPPPRRRWGRPLSVLAGLALIEAALVDLPFGDLA